MRALVTGITGFVGQYLEKQLIAEGAEVFGTTSKSVELENVFRMHLEDKDQIIKVIKEVKPTHIFHLAGKSNVRDSWVNISKTMEVNTIGTANLLQAIYQVDNGIRVLTIGSSEEYGKVNNTITSIDEECTLNPISPYGVSKAAVSMLIKQFQKAYEVDVIHLRPFNHIGPGQRLGFVTSDFAYQIAKINKANQLGNGIKVGNLETIRDFTDVRDIARAYTKIALYGKSGEVYNVCSGKGTKINEILNKLLSFSEKKIDVISDYEKIRVSEVPCQIGDNGKLQSKTEWRAQISLETSLQDVYQYWYKKA